MASVAACGIGGAAGPWVKAMKRTPSLSPEPARTMSSPSGARTPASGRSARARRDAARGTRKRVPSRFAVSPRSVATARIARRVAGAGRFAPRAVWMTSASSGVPMSATSKASAEALTGRGEVEGDPAAPGERRSSLEAPGSVASSVTVAPNARGAIVTEQGPALMRPRRRGSAQRAARRESSSTATRSSSPRRCRNFATPPVTSNGKRTLGRRTTSSTTSRHASGVGRASSIPRPSLPIARRRPTALAGSRSTVGGVAGASSADASPAGARERECDWMGLLRVTDPIVRRSPEREKVQGFRRAMLDARGPVR